MDAWIGLSEIVRNLALAGVAVVGLYAVWRRMQAATRQADATLEQQRIANDVLVQGIFEKAVDSLASDSLSVRVSGIVSLGGLAVAEPPYKGMAITILTAYLEEQEPSGSSEASEQDIAEAARILTMLKAD